jgi:hypothetical protein
LPRPLRSERTRAGRILTTIQRCSRRAPRRQPGSEESGCPASRPRPPSSSPGGRGFSLVGRLLLSHGSQTTRAIPRRRGLHGPQAAFPALRTKISFALHRRFGPEPLAGSGDVLGHRFTPHSRNRNTDSALSATKRSMSSARACKTAAISRVDALPRHTWMTCGGWPGPKRERESRCLS